MRYTNTLARIGVYRLDAIVIRGDLYALSPAVISRPGVRIKSSLLFRQIEAFFGHDVADRWRSGKATAEELSEIENLILWIAGTKQPKAEAVPSGVAVC